MQQLRYFVALCDEQNFSRAAKRCGVAQPSLTRGIKQMEAEFGGPLFMRSRRTTQLSSLGKIVRPYLAKIDQSVTDAKREAAKFLNVHPVSTVKPKEKSMHKVVYGTAIAAAALLLTVGANLHTQLQATASSPTQSTEIMDIRALMSTIDVKALPRQDILSEADE